MFSKKNSDSHLALTTLPDLVSSCDCRNSWKASLLSLKNSSEKKFPERKEDGVACSAGEVMKYSVNLGISYF